MAESTCNAAAMKDLEDRVSAPLVASLAELASPI